MSYTLRIQYHNNVDITKEMEYNEVIDEILRYLNGLTNDNFTTSDVVNNLGRNGDVQTYTRMITGEMFICNFWESESDKEN